MYKLLVTSADVHDGKSTICKQLAKEKSLSGKKVLLMDMDFSESYRIGKGNGIVEYICSRGTVNLDIMQEDGYDVVLPSKNKWYRYFNQREMPFLNKLLCDFETKYDIAIIDTPPVKFMLDVYHFCSFSDEIIVVNSAKSNAELALNRLKDAGFQAKVVDNFF